MHAVQYSVNCVRNEQSVINRLTDIDSQAGTAGSSLRVLQVASLLASFAPNTGVDCAFRTLPFLLALFSFRVGLGDRKGGLHAVCIGRVTVHLARKLHRGLLDKDEM